MARAHPDIAGLVEWQPLARGGFSSVWQARQESLDRLVAVKVDHRPLNEDKERRRFLREAGAAGRLSGHPGIVTVHDAGILDDGRPYLVMDLCPGGSLTQWLKVDGRQSEQRVRDVGVRIADALAAAHARGVLHRDVKPANILIDSYENPGLADFGLAALPEPGVELSVTLEGMTPAYAPKEVFYLKPPTEFGDVYSLAATLYALMDGKPPRWPDSGTPSLPELLELQREPIQRLPQVDDTFMDVLLAAMDDDPEERPTAAEFRDQLAELTFTTPATGPDATDPPAPGGEADVGGDDDQAAAASVEMREPREAKRRTWVLALVGALVVAALVLIGLFNWGPGTGSATPGPLVAPTTDASTTVPSTLSEPSPSPTAPTPVPEGFIDCSDQLGKTTYCIGAPECWNSVISYVEQPFVGVMQDCDKEHQYQTFAAGTLPVPIMSQPQLEQRKEIKKVCNLETLNKVLVDRKGLKDWEIIPLPPQINIKSDNLYRCIFGFGPTKGAVKLKTPK